MGPEWIYALTRLNRREAASGLADPLEGEAWRGLQGAALLLARLLGGRKGRHPDARR